MGAHNRMDKEYKSFIYLHMQIYPLKEFWESIIKDLPLRMFYIPDWAYRPGPAVDFRTWPFCDCAPL